MTVFFSSINTHVLVCFYLKMSAKSSSRTTGQQATASTRPSVRTPKQPTDYSGQEEEYKWERFIESGWDLICPDRRLNAQLEAKTQALVEEAEQVLVGDISHAVIRLMLCPLSHPQRNQDRLLGSGNNDRRTFSLLDQVDTDDQLYGWVETMFLSMHERLKI